MAKGIRYNHSDNPGDWTIAAAGSTLYELIMERRDPKTRANEERLAELKVAIEKSYLESEAEFRKHWSPELIHKYYGNSNHDYS